VGDPGLGRGGLVERRPRPPARRVWLLQRKESKPGATLGRTTGWIHRAALAARRVELLAGVRYEEIDDRGLTISIRRGGRRERRLLEVDNVVLCAGQEPLRTLEEPLRAAGVKVHRAGGADVAAELDAKRAVEQATRLAAAI
jgi:2,4-dienoyl-CoA reductase (NADPH2)